jgi:hypothetical protein
MSRWKPGAKRRRGSQLLKEGTAVLVRGKLRWKKAGEKPGALVVAVWQVHTLVTVAGNNNGGQV